MLIKTLIMLFSVLTLTSCSWCQKEVFVDRKVPYNVYVPQKCIVPPPEGCDWSQSPQHEVSLKLLECIIELKENTKVCQ